MERLTCIGCGVEIQTEDKEKLGYTPPSTLTKETIICQRCYRLKNYNEIQDVSLTDDDFLKILNGLGTVEGLIVKVVDIFDFNGSWLPGLHRFVGNNKVILIGNKVDLLPQSVKHNRLIQWMKKEAKELGLKPVDVFLVSAEKGHGIVELMKAIDRIRARKDVYVVGCTNVGKSTLINRIIQEATGEKQVITTSHFPGTTLDMIEIPLDDNASLFDTPGIVNHHQMAHFVHKQELPVITPKKEIKPASYQLNEGQTLFFGGLARFDYVKGGHRSFICHFSNALKIHRTKLEKADELYKNHVGELLQPPRENFPPLVAKQFTIKKPNTDIVVSGLGWITCQEPNAQVVIHTPKGVQVLLRESLI